MFITFEGLDFSGKTTQARLLVDTLNDVFPPTPPRHIVHVLREPGGTAISERIRDILLDKQHLEMSDMAELLLFSASRTQLVTEIIKPALQRGELCVCDRYYDSTTAYQGYGRGLNLDEVRTINRIATGGLSPDRTFFIDIPVDEIARRKAAAGLPFDRMESAGREFYERVRDGYYAIAAAEPERVKRINGAAAVDEVAREVWKVMQDMFEQRNVVGGTTR